MQTGNECGPIQLAGASTTLRASRLLERSTARQRDLGVIPGREKEFDHG